MSGMPYWLAKLLGRANGDSVATCEVCGEHFPRRDGLRATGAAGLMCSAECAEQALESRAW